MNATQTKGAKTMTSKELDKKFNAAHRAARSAAQDISDAIRDLREAGKLPRGSIMGWAAHSRIGASIYINVADRKTSKGCRVAGGVESILVDMFKGLEEAGTLPKGNLEIWANHKAYRKNLDFTVSLGA